MRLLVIGGTLFLGRALVECALARGHEVTLFHRGRTNPELFPEVERRLGDRASDLHLLEDGHWDAVVDTCGQVPQQVRAAARLLAGRVSHYTFISTISVYPDFGTKGAAADAELHEAADESLEAMESLGQYGPLKVACEEAVREEMGGRCCILRPGLIVGPWDFSDRFTHWPRRLARGGEVLAPLPRERLVQLIDVRDLAAYCLGVAERRVEGTIDVTGPVEPLSFERMVSTCDEVAGTGAALTWVDPDWLLEQGVGPWMELPLWVPGIDARIDLGPAVASGLRCRELADTVRATLSWAEANLPAERTPRAGLAAEREAELLAAWRARTIG